MIRSRRPNHDKEIACRDFLDYTSDHSCSEQYRRYDRQNIWPIVRYWLRRKKFPSRPLLDMPLRLRNRKIVCRLLSEKSPQQELWMSFRSWVSRTTYETRNGRH